MPNLWTEGRMHSTIVYYELAHLQTGVSAGAPGTNPWGILRDNGTVNFVVWTNVPWSCRAPLVAQMVKNLPAMQETRVQSLSREDPLEKGMATHPSILTWRMPWTEEPERL